MPPQLGPGSTPARQPPAQPAAPLGMSLSARCLQSTSQWALQPPLHPAVAAPEAAPGQQLAAAVPLCRLRTQRGSRQQT